MSQKDDSSSTSPPQMSHSYASSPGKSATSANESNRRPSPIRDLIEYLADLPSLSEVKAACDCYSDEVGDLGIVSLSPQLWIRAKWILTALRLLFF